MPRIQPYEQQVSSDGIPSVRRANVNDFNSSSPDAGAGLMDAGEKLFDVAQRQEVSDVQTKLAKARADWTVELAKRASEAPAGDSTFSEKFTQDFGDYLQTVQDNLQTRAGQLAFKQGAAELSAHMAEKAGLYQIQSAGVKATQDYQQALDANRNTLIMDPTQFESVLKQTVGDLNNPNGLYAKMPSDQRYKLERMTREQLALSAVQGEIKLNPEFALKNLQDGKWAPYLDADKTYSITKQAEIAIHAKEIESERKLRIADRETKKAQEAEKNAVIVGMFPADGSPTKLTAPDIANNPRLDPDQKPLLISMLARESKPDPLSVVSHDKAMEFFTRMRLPEGDPLRLNDLTPVDKAFADGDLNKADLKFVRDEFAQMRTPQGEKVSSAVADAISAVRGEILKANPIMAKLDPTGGEQLYRFKYDLNEKIRQAGDKWTDLFNPSSKDYVMSPGALKPYLKTFQESMKDAAARMRAQPGAVAPGTGAVPDDKRRRPGETIDQWRSRTGAN